MTQTTGAGGGLSQWEPQQGAWAVRAAYTHANPTQLQARGGGAGAVPSASHPLHKPVRSRDRVKEVFMPEVTLVRLVSLSPSRSVSFRLVGCSVWCREVV